jgi:hypothetical protein
LALPVSVPFDLAPYIVVAEISREAAVPICTRHATYTAKLFSEFC